MHMNNHLRALSVFTVKFDQWKQKPVCLDNIVCHVNILSYKYIHTYVYINIYILNTFIYIIIYMMNCRFYQLISLLNKQITITQKIHLLAPCPVLTSFAGGVLLSFEQCLSRQATVCHALSRRSTVKTSNSESKQ